MGSISTEIYTSELIVYFTICVHSATRHNIHMLAGYQCSVALREQRCTRMLCCVKKVLERRKMPTIYGGKDDSRGPRIILLKACQETMTTDLKFKNRIKRTTAKLRQTTSNRPFSKMAAENSNTLE